MVPDGRVPVAVTDGTTAINVAGNLAAAIAAAGPSGVTPRLDANRLNLEGASFVLASAGSSIEVEGSFGTAETAVKVHAEMTDNDVAVAVAESLADVFANGVTEVVKTFGNIVRVYGHRVSDPGPLGLAAFLRGDESGSFSNLADGPPAIGGLNNNAAFYEVDGNNDYDNFENEFFVDYDGVYVDDIIIGFASRGEALTDDRVPYPWGPEGPPFDEEGRVPDIFAQQSADMTQTFSNSINVGTYQVEIRVADPEIGILDPADRVEPGITLFAPSGPELFDGKTFTIGDGQRLVTFEYEDLTRSDGVVEGHVPITTDYRSRVPGGKHDP